MARPTVRILSRYLLRQHLAPLGFALAAFTLLMLLRQVAQQFGNLVGKGLPWSVILEVFLLSVPFIIAMTLPMAVLVAVLYAFSQLAGDHEITAMKASGVSLGRLVAPVLSAAALVAALAFLWSDQVLPRSNHRLRTLLVDIQRKKPSFSLKEQVINEVVERQFFLRAARIDPATNRLRDVTIYDLGDPEVVDRDVPQPVGRRIDACRPEEELALHDLVDHLLLQAEGRLLALDVHEQGAQPVVRAGQHLIAPQERQRCDQRGRRQHRGDEPPQADAARLHRRDLVIPRELAERVQHGHEHGHGQRHRDDEGDGEKEDLEDDAPRQALADEVAELLGHLPEQHQEGERREREPERREVLAQQVAAEDAHGQSRHYIRSSSSLQGMRRASLAGFVALSLVIPQAHAQDAGAARFEPPGFVASFRWTPLAPPRHPALVPGGRLGPHTAPALVAAAWERRARALWSPALGQPMAAAPVAAAAPSPIPPEPAPPVVVPAAAPAPPGAFADVRMQLNGRFELKARQLRNLPPRAID